MTTEELQAIRERAERASPGPWRVECSDDGYYRIDPDIAELGTEVSRDNRLFLAHARSDIPALLAALDEERAARRSCVFAVVDTIGGEVESAPTNELNYLQRLRQLVRAEALRADHESEMEYHADKIVAENDALREKVRAFEAWLDKFEADTRALPIQHEDESKGQSSFNWRMGFVRELRAALSPTETKDGEK